MDFKKFEGKEKPFVIDNKHPKKKFRITILLILTVLVVLLIVVFIFNSFAKNNLVKSSEKSTNRVIENQVEELQIEKTKEAINLEKIITAVDVQNETTRNYAVNLASKFPGNYNIDQVCKIYDYVLKNWKYVNDPRGFEFFSSASNTIKTNLSGDCDDFAILIGALLQSVGGRVRISFATNSSGGHAFTEVYFKDNPKNIKNAINKHYQDFFDKLLGVSKVDNINYRKDSDGGFWLNLDWTSKYPGGKYYDWNQCTIYYPFEKYYISNK